MSLHLASVEELKAELDRRRKVRPARAQHTAAALFATERYALLVRQLGRETGELYGWKTAAARRLGISPSYLNQILAGNVRFVAPEILQRAIDRLGLDARFFVESSL